MKTAVFPSLDGLLANRGILRRQDGSFVEDSYDFGVMWRDRRGGVFRLTWVGPFGRDDGSARPGELYLLRLRGGSDAELLCVVEPSPSPPYDASVELVLDGWAEACGPEGSVDWVRERVRDAIRDGLASPTGPVAVGREVVRDG